MTFLTLTTSLTHSLLHEQLDLNVPWGLVYIPFVFKCVFCFVLVLDSFWKVSRFQNFHLSWVLGNFLT